MSLRNINLQIHINLRVENRYLYTIINNYERQLIYWYIIVSSKHYKIF